MKRLTKWKIARAMFTILALSACLIPVFSDFALTAIALPIALAFALTYHEKIYHWVPNDEL